MNPALIEALMEVARAAEAAPHGQKQAVYQEAASRMGMSLATLHRKIKEVFMPVKTRKSRSDAGATSLSRADALAISTWIMESARKNNKRLCTVKNALAELRATNPTFAHRINEETGELKPLSESAVSRALYQHRMHPEQLARPEPRMQLRSLHPNHVWQIDPSLCVVYYLPKAQGEGMRVMDEKTFYKNKPQNIERIEKERVWRYVITDHTSGWIYVHYVPGAETGKNLAEIFIAATQKRGSSDPVNGIPKMVMVDPGSANTGAVFRNLCEGLGIKLQVNQPGQPWAKGQVEKANDIVECDFEHRIRMMTNAPQSIDELNTLAWKWMRWFNATAIHSRTKETRYSTWMRITEEQLIIAPSAKVMRELCYSAPKQRTVSPQLTIDFNGQDYSVAQIPSINVGEKVMVTINPWREKNAQVVTEKDGQKIIYVLEPVKRDDWGFAEQGAVIDQEYKRHADTDIDKNRKAANRLAMDAATDDEATQKRKGKYVPFGGRIDPMKNIDDAPKPEYLPKRAQPTTTTSPVAEPPKLRPVALAKKIALQIGSEWKGAEHFAWLKQRYPDGAPEEEITTIIQQLRSAFASPLRVIK